MLPVILAAYLVCLFLFVNLKTNRAPDKVYYLLNDDLPFIAAGHGSSIFSLTALFGCYFAIMYLIGIYALIGLAVGSIAGLIMIQKNIKKAQDNTFHSFLKSVFKTEEKAGLVFLSLVSITQVFFAISELLIMKEILQLGLGVDPKYSTYFTVGLGLIAYLYCLQNGYLAIYKTDLLQYIAIILMCSIFLVAPFFIKISFQKGINFGGEAKHLWTWGHAVSPLIRIPLDFVVGLCMGTGYILASPNTWKRIFITTKTGNKNSFWILVIAGLVPFILISPTLFTSGNASNIDSPIKFLVSIYSFTNPFIISILLLGFVSSFLSSFGSALISSVHLISVKYLADGNSEEHERTIFNFRLGLTFLVINICFCLCLYFFKNPYFLGNLLLGPFAIISAILIGTNGFKNRLSTEVLMFITVGALLIWFIYLISIPNVIDKEVIDQIGTVPTGVIIAIFIALTTYLLSKKSN